MADDSRDRRHRKLSAVAVLDRIRHLKQQAVVHQRYDVAAWEHVVDDLRSLGVYNDDTRTAYEEVLELMPSAASVWVRYADLVMGDNLEAVKVLFGRCLLACPSVDLHSLYLRFIKKSNDGRGVQGVLELRMAYEFSLDTIGQDIASGSVWQEYIQFLQAPRPGSDAFKALYSETLEGQEEAARTPVVRRAFQRAVGVPCHHLEAIWRSYEAWETKVDKQLGRKMLEEWRPRFQAARNVYRERKQQLEHLAAQALPFPPGKGGAFQAKQAQLWKAYIDFERANPQRLEPGSPVLASRVSLAFSQCLSVLWFFPEVWYQYAQSQLMTGDIEAALPVLARGQAALPGCSLLRFAQAELLEISGQVEPARQVYDDMVEALEAELPPQQGEVAGSNGSGEADRQASLSPYGGDQGVLIWLQYIRFAKRTADQEQARQLFLRARRWQQQSIALAPSGPPQSAGDKTGAKPTGGQLYAGMANLEWSWAKEKNNPAIASRIFELGLEDQRLCKDATFILAYNTFLCEVGDVDNARALFERVLSEAETSSLAAVWRAYVVLEVVQGNMQAALQVEERMRVALAAASEPGGLPPGAPPPLPIHMATLQSAVCRFSQEGLLPCLPSDAGYLRQASGLAQEQAGEQGELVEHVGREAPGRDRYERERHRRDERPRDWDRESSMDDLLPRGGARDDGGGEPAQLDLIDLLMSQLPPGPGDGPPLPVEAVMDVIMYADYRPETIAAVCAELDVGQIPSGINGVAVPQLLGLAARPYPDDMPPPSGSGFHPPPYDHHDGRGSPGPDAYMYPPPYGPPSHMGPPGGPPMSRKRRWDGPPPEGRGPPPPYEYDREGYPVSFDEPYGPGRGPGQGPPPPGRFWD